VQITAVYMERIIGHNLTKKQPDACTSCLRYSAGSRTHLAELGHCMNSSMLPTCRHTDGREHSKASGKCWQNTSELCVPRHPFHELPGVDGLTPPAGTTTLNAKSNTPPTPPPKKNTTYTVHLPLDSHHLSAKLPVHLSSIFWAPSFPPCWLS